MDVKQKDSIISQIENILEEYNNLRNSYRPIRYSVAYYDTQEGAKITKLITKTKVLISNNIGEDSQYYKQVDIHSSKISRNNLALVMADLQALDEDLKSDYIILNESQNEKTQDLSDKIFIVHGKNEEMKQSVARLLEKLDLTPIILHEKPSQGKTIIERFETYSDVGFAVVLFSPDDMGYSKEKGPESIKSRARQNVILELGYFFGKLGRNKAVALYLEDELFEMPTDILGVLYLPYDRLGAWRYKLVDELKACGYNVSKDKI